MISIRLNNIDITGMVESVTWSGSWEETARSCDVSYANAPYDPVVSKLPTPKAGDYITVIDDQDGELFYGQCQGNEKKSDYGTLTANCMEDSNFLLKSKCKYSFENVTPEEVAKRLLDDAEFPYSGLAPTGVNLKSYIVDGKTYYDAIKEAYKEASKQNGKTYMFRMSGRSLKIEEAKDEVAEYFISEDFNITSSSYKETTDSIVNKVIIYDKKGNRAGEISDGSSISRYGVHQDIYKQEDGKDNAAAARNMLKKPEQSMSVSVIGNNKVVSGKVIILKDSATGQSGKYWVKSDKHVYQNGIHTMDLELSFEELKAS